MQAIVTIAQGLGKKTVAEFVTDQESTSLLRKIGVDCAQGYYIGEPRLITEALRIRHPQREYEAEPGTRDEISSAPRPRLTRRVHTYHEGNPLS